MRMVVNVENIYRQPEPDPAAQALARRRWDAMTPEERTAATAPARRARARKREEAADGRV